MILVYFNKNYERFIELSPEFLRIISERILENSTTKIMVLNKNLSPDFPIQIDNIYLYNRLSSEFSELLNALPKQSDGWRDLSPTYRTLLKLSILNFLGSFSGQYYIFQKVLKYLEKTKRVVNIDMVPEIEGIMEFKGRDLFYKDGFTPKDSSEIVQELLVDIITKLNEFPFKFYVVGINKESRRIEPLKEGNFWDDIIRKDIYEPLGDTLEKEGI